jgi:hypothetical protein
MRTLFMSHNALSIGECDPRAMRCACGSPRRS